MNKPKSNYKIALYIRVSTEEQAENPEGSIKNQEDRLRTAVEYKNRMGSFGEIKGVFIDAGISAKNMKRPKLQELLSAIRQKEINLVMVTELSRLSRNTRDFIDMWDMMRENSCSFTSLREDFDTTSAAGEMVLFQLMNLAQFERKQTSERVAANIAARAGRGLYNGGTVPVGYKTITDRPGFLEVDEPMAKLIQTAFHAFLKEGCLSKAALWLNEQGYVLRKNIEGGGRFKRVGHFTVDNLQTILRSKTYLGIKAYTVKGEKKEAKAVWPSIIDEATFYRVNALLDKNKNRYKPYKAGKFPYLLTGIMYCKCCGSHMPGKSATGRSGKVGYYEHAWATKRDATLSKKMFRCEPYRVPSRFIEPVVWEKIKAFVNEDDFIRSVLEKVRKHHLENPLQKDKERIKAKIYGINSQIDALAERLSELPKSVSAAPIYKQMEKLTEINNQNKQELEKLQSQGFANYQNVINFDDFEKFAKAYREMIQSGLDFVQKKDLVKKFVNKIEVGVETLKIHFIVDEEHYRQSTSLPLLGVGAQNFDFFKNFGSNTLTFGAPDWT